MRTLLAAAVLLAACGQPQADELPDGAVAVVPSVLTSELRLGGDLVLLDFEPRTPVGRLYDDAIRGARAAELVAALGRGAPEDYVPACTAEGHLLLIVPAAAAEQAAEVVFDTVRALDDFLDVTEPVELPPGDAVALTCQAAGRPLPR